MRGSFQQAAAKRVCMRVLHPRFRLFASVGKFPVRVGPSGLCSDPLDGYRGSDRHSVSAKIKSLVRSCIAYKDDCAIRCFDPGKRRDALSVASEAAEHFRMHVLEKCDGLFIGRTGCESTSSYGGPSSKRNPLDPRRPERENQSLSPQSANPDVSQRGCGTSLRVRILVLRFIRVARPTTCPDIGTTSTEGVIEISRRNGETTRLGPALP